MTLLIEILAAVLVAAALVAVGLRFRKLRRDELLGRSAKIDRRLLAPPPSPYATSKGFRLLDGTANDPLPTSSSTPPRPRLEADHDYVFSDAQLPPYDVGNLARLRHDEQWALTRSARRTNLSTSVLRTLVIAGLLVLVLIVVAYYLTKHNKPSNATTTTSTVARTTTSRPSSLGRGAPLDIVAAQRTNATILTGFGWSAVGIAARITY